MAANGWDKLGLNRDPLAEGPVPWHFSRPEAENFESLAHLLSFSGLMLLVVGPRGVGKTRHAKLFQQQLRGQFRVMAMTVSPALSLKQLQAGLAQELDLRGVSGSAADWARLFSEREWPQPPLLLLDAAECLSEDILLFLLELNIAQQGLTQGLRIVLYAESGFAQRLSTVYPNADKWLYLWALPLLDTEDFKRYLLERLQRCGWKRPWPVEDSKWQSWILRCHGAPGQLAAHVPALQQLLLEAVKPETFSMLGRVQGYWRQRGKDWFILILTLLLIIPLLIFQEQINALFSAKPAASASVKPVTGMTPMTALTLANTPSPAEPMAVKALPTISAEPLPSLWPVSPSPQTNSNQPQTTPALAAEVALFTEDEQQILLLKPEGFTLWLLITKPEQLKLWRQTASELRIYSLASGQQAIVWGSFVSKNLALQQLKQLATELQATKPSVKKVGDIQAQIRQAKSD